jgi:beta-lactam-binding protein with PASTA domain
VPRLTGKTLPETRRLLRASRCRLGAVRGHRRSGDKVIKQSPRPGLARPAGWAVNVTID